ncbi:MAG: hypothetical protein LBI87_11065 [Candidatus Accumulibacter sp.]|nr:hypothetical protein [Accumulibacter sp.]
MQWRHFAARVATGRVGASLQPGKQNAPAWKVGFPQIGKKLVELLVKDMGGGQAARALQDLNELAVPENEGKPFAGYPSSASPTPVH